MAAPERPAGGTGGGAEPPALVPRGAVRAADRAALERGAALALHERLAHFRLTGSGRVTCLQGLVTCDVERAGDDALSFGALLTAKGMIVAPLWIARAGEEILVSAPVAAGLAVAAVLERSLPPRLCQWADASRDVTSVGVYGPAASDALAPHAGGSLPDAAGRVGRLTCDGRPALAARIAARGLDGFECLLPTAAAHGLARRLAEAGAVPIPDALLEERRILAGFPRLGAEIDEKTLPQEVRLDLLGAVSYTKGCYLGQETVARLHFRGHANRQLVGVELDAAPASLPAELLLDDRPIGRMTSACWWEAAARTVGLAVVRHEVEIGATARTADGTQASVRTLPWERPPESA